MSAFGPYFFTTYIYASESKCNQKIICLNQTFNQWKMAIFGFDLENEISVCVRNWKIENPDSWLLSKKVIHN